MSIAVVVKKGNRACIAADTQTTWGSLVQNERYLENPSKIIKFQDSYIVSVGAGAHDPVLRHFFQHHPDTIDLSGIEAIFSTWLTLHTHLTQDYHLNPRREDDDAYETSRISALIANPTGLYIVASMRSVDSLKRFWAIGSGQEYALGAMHALYEQCEGVEEIAQAGLAAAIEFDDACGYPTEMHTIPLATPLRQNRHAAGITSQIINYLQFHS